LGIETSCDETGIGIVEDGRRVLANVVASSQQVHRPYGGVVPELAARAHVEVLWSVLEDALAEAGVALAELDAIAVTRGPGLPGALLVGLAFAKGLALGLDRPLIGVDHLAAHLHAGEMVEPDLAPPYVGLVVSGGHTLLCVAHADQRFEVLGETQDDAVGEAFDKVARLLGLGYPGGPEIDRLSDEGSPQAIAFPRQTAHEGFSFSFSGLKTAVVHQVRKSSRSLPDASPQEAPDRRHVADIAASFQEAAVDIVVAKALRACQRTGIGTLVVGGGVAANRRLKERLMQEGASRRLRIVVPPGRLCVDNGAMVAGVAYPMLQRGEVAPLSVNADPRLHLT